MASPKVAVINSDLLQQRILAESLQRLGFEVVLNIPAARMSLALIKQTEADAWLVTVRDDDEVCGESFDSLLDGEAPVLVGMDDAQDNN